MTRCTSRLAFGLAALTALSAHTALTVQTAQAAARRSARTGKSAKPAARKPAKPAAPAAASGPFTVLQPLSRVGARVVPTGALSLRGTAGAARWLRNSSHEGRNYPLFPPGLPVGTGAALKAGVGGALPEAPVLTAQGEVKEEPARWLTAVAGTRTLTLPVGAQEAFPPVQITPQVSGSVVSLNGSLPLGVTLTNLGGAMRNWTLEYRALSASGTPFATGTTRVTVPAMHRLTTPLSVGPLSIPGSVTVTVTARDGATVVGSATTGGGAVVPVAAVKTSEFPFGLAGGDMPLAAAAGTQLHAGGWPWIGADGASDGFGQRTDPAPGSGEGAFWLGDRTGVSLISRAYTGNPEAHVRYAQNAMTHFKRRGGGWTVPYTPDLTPIDYASLMASLHTVSKGIHKDALTFLELPPASEAGVEAGRAAGAAGAENATDIVGFRGIGFLPTAETFRPTLESALAMRDEAYPGREVWNTGETMTDATLTPVQQAGMVVRSSVEQLVAGMAKVFWSADGGLLREDGSAGPAFFGLASLSVILSGTEYVGPMPWDAPARGEVFQKNGGAILVAWSDGQLPMQVQLPLQAAGAPEARDPMNTRANLAALTGRRLTVRSVPVFVTGLGKNLLPEAYATGRAKRAEAAKAALDALGVDAGTALTEPLTLESGAELLETAMNAYRPDSPKRGQALTAVSRILDLWDLDALARASADTTSNLMNANKALDTANRAQADFRVELDYREGVKGYQPELRTLLAQAEKRLWLSRVGLRQKDFALARAHAEQMAAASRALIPYVKSLPVGMAKQGG